MKSYKNWKLINESFIPGMTLGISHPKSLGLQSNLPGISLSEKKKMGGEVVIDDEEPEGEEDCSCKHKKSKHHEPDGDEVKFSKKKMKKKMKKHMDGDVNDYGHEDDDVNDVDVPDDDHEDDDHDDHDDYDDDEMSDDHDEEDHEDDHDEEDHEDDHDEEDHDEDDGDDAPKFGFMKDKKKSKRKDESAFWEDISANYHVPKNEIGTDKEFFDSLARQYGNPHVRFSGGVDRVDEDLLLSPEQEALINAMPRPGEVGYSPVQRLGGGFTPVEEPDLDYTGYGESTEYDEEDASDFEVLCKYFSESVARDLIEKRHN
jgi:hypothetical protein